MKKVFDSINHLKTRMEAVKEILIKGTRLGWINMFFSLFINVYLFKNIIKLTFYKKKKGYGKISQCRAKILGLRSSWIIFLFNDFNALQITLVIGRNYVYNVNSWR